MKENIKNLVVVKNSQSEFTHTFIIPFKEYDDKVYRDKISGAQIITTFKDVIVSAVIARMNSCVAMLYRNIDRIICSDKYQVVFERKDGSIHSFNHPSYQAMVEVLEIMDREEYFRFQKGHMDQILKALFWVEKPEKRKNISFGDLISCLMEVALSPSLT